jgi:RNase P/RNase MRP subunit p29
MSDLFEDAKEKLNKLVFKVHEANPDLWIRTEETRLDPTDGDVKVLEYKHKYTGQKVAVLYRPDANEVSIKGCIWRSSEKYLKVHYGEKTITVREEARDIDIKLAKLETDCNFFCDFVTEAQTDLQRMDLIVQHVYRAIRVETS